MSDNRERQLPREREYLCYERRVFVDQARKCPQCVQRQIAGAQQRINDANQRVAGAKRQEIYDLTDPARQQSFYEARVFGHEAELESHRRLDERNNPMENLRGASGHRHKHSGSSSSEDAVIKRWVKETDDHRAREKRRQEEERRRIEWEQEQRRKGYAGRGCHYRYY